MNQKQNKIHKTCNRKLRLRNHIHVQIWAEIKINCATTKYLETFTSFALSKELCLSEPSVLGVPVVCSSLST